MSKKKKQKSVPPTLEEAFGKLSPAEEMTELAKRATVVDVYGYLQKNERKKISKFVYERFNRRYIMPFEKVYRDFNSGFAQMAACCLKIEAMQSFRYGSNNTIEDAKKQDGTRMFGGEIFEDFFGIYGESKDFKDFKDFKGLGNEFYSSIRCGILHQAEPQNGWLILREGKLYDDVNRSINSTRFRRRMKKCLKQYCDDLEVAENDSELWKKFKDKMAFVILNCHKEEMLKELTNS